MPNVGLAQDVDASMASFNEAIGAEYNVSNKAKIFIVEGFREGEQVKVDKVNVFELDMKTLKYSEVDKSVSISCYADFDGCVNRTLTRERNKKSYRNRIVFGISDNVSGEEIVTKLQLVLTELSEKY